MLFLVYKKEIKSLALIRWEYPLMFCRANMFYSAIFYVFTFETSHQVLTSIDTTGLTPCCSLLFVYNSMLLIVECLKWVMYVMCEHQCVSDLGLL